jgi:hypothetical protein
MRVLDHQEIDVAVGPSIAASPAAEQNDAIRIYSLHQSANHFLKQGFIYYNLVHGSIHLIESRLGQLKA